MESEAEEQDVHLLMSPSLRVISSARDDDDDVCSFSPATHALTSPSLLVMQVPVSAGYDAKEGEITQNVSQMDRDTAFSLTRRSSSSSLPSFSGLTEICCPFQVEEREDLLT